MKLLTLLFIGCIAQADKVPDAGISNNQVYVEYQTKWLHEKYYPRCLNHCLAAGMRLGYYMGAECREKCTADFKQIDVVLLRAIRDKRENDLYEILDQWWSD